MPDGTKLSANIGLPAQPGRYPAVLTVTPYGKNGSAPAALAGGASGCTDPSAGDLDGFTSNGTAVIVVDERGTGNSQGTTDLSGPSVARDGQDILDWIQAQPWSNGKVGNIGCSALGMSAEYVLQGEQERLAAGKKKAIYATWADSPPGGDQYRDVSFDPGGAGSGAISILAPALIYEGTSSNDPTNPDQQQAVLNQSGGGLSYLDYERDFQSDGPLAYDGPYWHDRAFDPHAGKVRTPVMLTAAAWDLVAIQRGAFATWMALKHASKRVLLSSPGYHCGPTHLDTAGYGTRKDMVHKWFDHYLKRVENGIDKMPNINLYPQNGSEWWHADTFPIRKTQYVSYFLDPAVSGTAQSAHDGSLATSSPATPGREELVYAPANGLCSNSSVANAVGAVQPPFCAADNRAAEANSLTYTSSVMPHDTRLAGLITADLWATFNRTDGMVSATVTIVHPDGTSEPLEAGWLRASNRAIDQKQTLHGPRGIVIRPFHPDTKAAAEPVRSGYVERYLIEINPTAALIKAGDRLRLVVSITDAGILPSAMQAEGMAGETMWISHSANYPSRLIVPVVSAPSSLENPTPSTCASRRSVLIHLPARIKRAHVRVNGHAVAVRRRGARLTAPIDLRGRKRILVVIRITGRTLSGKPFTQTRRYHPCRATVRTTGPRDAAARRAAPRAPARGRIGRIAPAR
jgi:putative CocE/NonD family hydrolase